MSVKAGDRIAFMDDHGITWFGVAVTGIQQTDRWPVVLVELDGQRVEVPARDVMAWPTPEALNEHLNEPGLDRGSLNVRAAARSKSPFLCKIGDPVVVAELGDRSMSSQVRHFSPGVIAGITRSGKLVVRFRVAGSPGGAGRERAAYSKRLA